MSSILPSQSKTISIENLIALNDEIGALVAGGVPLELGLREIGSDYNSTLHGISERLGDHMSQGNSLPDALAAEGERFPQLYRIVVEAGLKAGRLPVALEAVSSFASNMRDLHTRIGLAMIYPLCVLGIAYAMFLFVVYYIVGRIEDFIQSLRMPMGTATKLLSVLSATVEFWWWIPPVLMMLCLGWWLLTGRARNLGFFGPDRPLRLIPVLQRIVRYHQCANFAELLALLVDNDVVLDEALVLAADATTDSQFRSSARTIADAVHRADVQESGAIDRKGIPSFLRWVIMRSADLGTLPRTLRQAGDMYRRRATSLNDWFKLSFPVLAVTVLGGGVTLLYALVVFQSFLEILDSLGLEVMI